MKLQRHIQILGGTALLFIVSVSPALCQTEYINNGGFESGATADWNMVGPVVLTTAPHTGTKNALMGEIHNTTDTMYQVITVPTNASVANLTYWYNITSSDTGATSHDILTVTIQNSSGTVLAPVDTKSNVNQDPNAKTYHQKTAFDLLPYKGSPIWVHFKVVMNGTIVTSFRIDDVSVLVTTNASETITTSTVLTGEPNPVQNTSYSYTINAFTSSLEHTLEYSFDWGDGTATSAYSTSRTASHSWSTTGQKYIIVTARCQTHTTVTANNSPGNFVTVALSAPTLNAPANASTGQSTNPAFSWSAVTDATSYRIIVATSAADLPTDPTVGTGGASVVINTTTTTTSYTPATALNAGTTYYWEVHGRNSTQFGTWSSVSSFTTVSPMPTIRIAPLSVDFNESATVSTASATQPNGGNTPLRAVNLTQAQTVSVSPSVIGKTVSDEIVIRFRDSEASLLHGHRLKEIRWDATSWNGLPAGMSPLPDAVLGLRPFVSGSAKVMQAIRRKPKLEGYVAKSSTLTKDEFAELTDEISTVKEKHGPTGLFYARLRKNADVEATCLEIMKREDVIYAHPNPACQTVGAPNDPLFGRMWNLSRMKVPQAWDSTGNTLENIRVAVIDTGVRITHTELSGRTADAKDVYPADGDAFADSDPNNDDPAGHGTGCAGIIAAIRDNSTLVAGVAPVTLIPVNAFFGLLNGQPQIANYNDGIRWAVDHGANVISMSFGRHGSPTADDLDAASYAETHGVVVCAAAGNDNGNADDFYPAAIPYYISVAAVDDANIRVRPPKWGWGSDYGNTVDLCAPGQGAVGASSDSILTLGRTSDTDWVNSFNGTSAATPQVAGVCALIKAANPSLNAVQIRHILESTAQDQVGDPAEDTIGRDIYHGYGLVNASAAVSSAKGSFVIFNDGNASLSVTSIAPESSASWISWSPQPPFAVPAGGSTVVTLSVAFNQAPAGQSTRRLLVYSSDSSKSPYPGGVNVTVTTLAPAISVTPTSQDFGSVQVNTTADRSFTVQNTGGGTLSGSASVSSPFSVVSGSPYSLTANQSTTVTVRYSPTVAGSDNQNVTFTGGSGASQSVSGSAYLPTVDTPTISPNGGSFADSVLVTLACTTASATIRYTTDGTDPTSGSTAYSVRFMLTSSVAVKAKAFKSGYNDSAIAAASFMVTPTVATPTITPNGGSFADSVSITLDCSTAGATIRYTTDASDPTGSSTAYSVPFTLTSSVTVKAKAFKSGYNDSAIAATSFTVTPSPPPTLSYAQQDGNLVFWWPTNSVGFTLEYTTNLPPTVWATATPPPVVVGTLNHVTNTTLGGNRFYRLKK